MGDSQLLRTVNWRSIRLDKETSRALSDEFYLAFLQNVLAADPENIELLIQLGDYYSRVGKVEESLKVDLRLVRLCPEEKVFHYNLACSYSVLGDLNSSLLALEKALLLGYDDIAQIQSDTDLTNLRDKRFQSLIRNHFHREPQL